MFGLCLDETFEYTYYTCYWSGLSQGTPTRLAKITNDMALGATYFVGDSDGRRVFMHLHASNPQLAVLDMDTGELLGATRFNEDMVLGYKEGSIVKMQLKVEEVEEVSLVVLE